MNRKSVSIYTAGLLQGIALVAFPAASTILTSPNAYNLTSTQYGSLFIPQAILSILAALLNSVFCRHFTAKGTLTAGLTANFLSMALLALSAATMGNSQTVIQPIDYSHGLPRIRLWHGCANDQSNGRGVVSHKE